MNTPAISHTAHPPKGKSKNFNVWQLHLCIELDKIRKTNVVGRMTGE